MSIIYKKNIIQKMSNCDQANSKKVFTMKQVIFNDNDERSKISNRKYYKLEGNDEIVLSSIEENPRIYPLNGFFNMNRFEKQEYKLVELNADTKQNIKTETNNDIKGIQENSQNTEENKAKSVEDHNKDTESKKENNKNISIENKIENSQEPEINNEIKNVESKNENKVKEEHLLDKLINQEMDNPELMKEADESFKKENKQRKTEENELKEMEKMLEEQSQQEEIMDAFEETIDSDTNNLKIDNASLMSKTDEGVAEKLNEIKEAQEAQKAEINLGNKKEHKFEADIKPEELTFDKYEIDEKRKAEEDAFKEQIRKDIANTTEKKGKVLNDW